MATRKRHNKPQFVIPEDVESREASGWTFRMDEAGAQPAPEIALGAVSKPEPVAAQRVALAAASESAADKFGPKKNSVPADAMETGIRALSYGVMAMGQMLLLSVQVATMPLTLATQVFRR